jgi:hypothetical protein
MASTNVRKSVIGIINEVERKLGVNESSFAQDNEFSKSILDFLNDTIDEVNDVGNWPQMFREITVSSQACVGSYEIAVSSEVKNIYEVHFGSQVSPLIARSISEMRVLQKTSGKGTPRQFCIVDTSGTNPKIRVYPIIGTAQSSGNFDVAYYKKNRLYSATSVDSSATPAFPSRMLVQGTFAKVLLEESGQEETPQFRNAEARYLNMRKEALNRLIFDTTQDMQITPTGMP